jgi:hypothetical protein
VKVSARMSGPSETASSPIQSLHRGPRRDYAL